MLTVEIDRGGARQRGKEVLGVADGHAKIRMGGQLAPDGRT
jgi:hypothetical protein